MSRDHGGVPVNLLVAICILVALCLLSTALIVIDRLNTDVDPETPTVAEEFIATYFQPNYATTDELDIFYECFADSEGVEEKFTEVCRMWSPGAVSFEVTTVSPNFSIIKMYDQDGGQITPPIGFWYECSDKITSWWIGRLQPFSRYDPEYSQLWEGLYGWN